MSRLGVGQDGPVRPEALFPVFLCTAVLAVAWTAILYDPKITLGSAGTTTTWNALSFGFIGAYVFLMQVLLRRYFQADLRAGAYVSGYVRIVVAMLLVLVLQAAMPPETPREVIIPIAFIVGWFPNAGMQWLLRFVSRRLRGSLPSAEPVYPLSRLDGLNPWYEARLLEEGIENLQNLFTTKIVDVLLHTRVPVERLIDWIDQALLLVHLPPEPANTEQRGFLPKTRAEKAAEEGDDHLRQSLRRCGIRSATSLVRALHSDRDPADREELLRTLKKKHPRYSVLSLEAVLKSDRRLAAIYNWQNGDAEPRQPLPLQPIPKLPC